MRVWAHITGTYVSEDARLFTTSPYAVYERGNVGDLVQATATVRDGTLTQDDRTELISTIETMNLLH